MSTEEVQEKMLCVNNSETSDIYVRKRKKEEDTEEDIERQAIEMILRESKRNKTRADSLGAIGWSALDRPKANKIFAKKIISSTVLNNNMSRRKKHH